MNKDCRVTVLRMALIGVHAVALSCCAVSPPPDALADLMTDDDGGLQLPASWGASKIASAGVDHHWIDRFEDAGLSAAVAEALASSPDLEVAAARLEVAYQNARLAGVPMNPTSNARFDGNRQKRNFIGFPFGGATDGVFSNITDSSGLALDVNWEIDLWGRMRAGASAALGEAQATGAQLRGVHASLAARVAKTWFALAEARMQLALAEETESSYRATEKAVRDRFETGGHDSGATGAQLRLARSDTLVAKAGAASRKEGIARLQRQLEVLLGRYPKGEMSGAAVLPAAPVFPPAGLPSELLARRPDIQAAERRLASQGQRIREAELAVFPSFSLTGSLGTATEELSDILDSDFGVWSLAGGLVQPILTGGQLRAERSKRRAQQREALANLQSTVLTACSEVETALAVDRLLAGRERALAEAMIEAGEAADEARVDYRAGVGDVLTVLAAQNRALRARSEHLATLRARLDNRVDLHLALGGDYRPATR